MIGDRKIRPLAGRVLIEQSIKPERTAGGIFLSERARLQSESAWLHGTVVAVAPDVTDVKVGDQVLFIPRRGGKVTPRSRTYSVDVDNIAAFCDVVPQ